jgi:hypothetical protein
MDRPASAEFTRSQWGALYVAVIAAAGSTLCLQLVQTRVLSSLYYNHLVYLTVTVALLGFGISGVLVAIIAPRVRRMEELAAAGLCGGAIFVPAAVGGASYLPEALPIPLILLKLLISYVLLVIPFIFFGTTLASIFMMGGKSINRLYFIDLAASAVGTLAFVFLLTPLTAEGLLWACSFASLLGFFVLSRAFGMSLRAPFQVLFLLVVGILCLHGNLIGSIPDFYKIGCPGYAKVTPEITRWTTITKIEVLTGPTYGTPPYDIKMVSQDREASTPIVSPAVYQATIDAAQGTDPKMSCPGSNFIAHPAPEDALIIGVGGGIDVTNAVAAHAKNITGIEINPETLGLLKHEYADFAVWPKRPNVELHCLDGRNYVASTTKRFDTINLTGIDTFSALSTGAYVLSENYLYTVEALKDYLRALKPDGILNIHRWNFRVPRESLRLCNLFLEASAENGNQHPEQCVMIIGADYGAGWQYRWASTLMKKEPFTQDEVNRVLGLIDREPSFALIYLPKIFPPDQQKALEEKYFQHDADYYTPNRAAFSQLIDAPSLEARHKFEDSYPYNVTPVYDNRPFFFEYHRVSEIFHPIKEPNDLGVRGVYVHYTLYILFFVTSIASYLGMIVPLHFFARDGLTIPHARALILYFAALGLGFMFIELGVIQSLNIYLGHPMYSLALVLAGLLFFTGLGSYLAGLRRAGLSTLVAQGMLGSCLVIVLWTLLMPSVIGATMGTSIFLRGSITLVSLIPLGLFMGIPFATGIRYLSDGQSRFIPWAWGINGMTSVMASILAILLAMRIGFKDVLILGALTYLVGYLVSRRFIKS